MCAAALLALVVSGCGEAQRRERHASQPAGGLRFVGAPDVRFAPNAPGGSLWLVTTVRVNRALPQGGNGVMADIAVTGTQADIPGLQRLDGVRRCYRQETFWDGPARPRDGQLVTVRLTVGGRDPQVLVARVRARADERLNNGSREGEVIRRLGCPGAPRRLDCEGTVPSIDPGYIAVAAAEGGATCATARRVLRAVGQWASEQHCEDLCAHAHPSTLGFRCTVAKVGEADWTITCRRGREVVRGYTGA